MELLHQQVHHAKFGDGEIVQQAETCVTVAFTAPFEEKHFLYPDAFAAFLTLCDPVQQRKMQQLLQERDAARQAARLAQIQAEEARRAAAKQAALALKKKALPQNAPPPGKHLPRPPKQNKNAASAPLGQCGGGVFFDCSDCSSAWPGQSALSSCSFFARRGGRRFASAAPASPARVPTSAPARISVG